MDPLEQRLSQIEQRQNLLEQRIQRLEQVLEEIRRLGGTTSQLSSQLFATV